MKRLVHFLLVIALVVAVTTTNGLMGLGAAAQPLAQPVTLSDDFNHCDACDGEAVVVMTCGIFCGSAMAAIAQDASVAPAIQGAAWTWENQIATTASIKPEHAPPRG